MFGLQVSSLITGTLLGDGDGGRFCAQRMVMTAFREVGWIFLRKAWRVMVFYRHCRRSAKVSSVAATGEPLRSHHSGGFQKLTVCFSPLSAAIVADNASWGIEWPVLRRCCCRCNFPHLSRRVRLLIAFMR